MLGGSTLEILRLDPDFIVLTAAPSEFLPCPSVGLLRVINKIKSLQELTVSKCLCCRAGSVVHRGCRQAAGCAEAWVSSWGSGCDLQLHVLPQPTICDLGLYWGCVPLGVRSVLYIGKGTLITATAHGVSDSHLQPTIADGAKGAQRSASPRRTWGGSVPTAESAGPGSSRLPAPAELQSKANSSLLGHEWAVLALGSWSTKVRDD